MNFESHSTFWGKMSNGFPFFVSFVWHCSKPSAYKSNRLHMSFAFYREDPGSVSHPTRIGFASRTRLSCYCNYIDILDIFGSWFLLHYKLKIILFIPKWLRWWSLLLSFASGVVSLSCSCTFLGFIFCWFMMFCQRSLQVLLGDFFAPRRICQRSLAFPRVNGWPLTTNRPANFFDMIRVH